MPPDPYRQLIGRKGGHVSWANAVDRSARTAAAQAALEQRFLDQAGGDPQRAGHLRQAYYTDLALKSAEARRGPKKDTKPTAAELRARSRAAAAQADADLTKRAS